MTIAAFNTIKTRRKHLMVSENSEIKAQIKQIKREIVLLSFQSQVNSINKAQLRKEMAELKLRLN